MISHYFYPCNDKNLTSCVSVQPKGGIPFVIGFVEGLSLAGHIAGTFVVSWLLKAPSAEHPEDHWMVYFNLSTACLVVVLAVFLYIIFVFEETNALTRRSLHVIGNKTRVFKKIQQRKKNRKRRLLFFANTLSQAFA